MLTYFFLPSSSFEKAFEEEEAQLPDLPEPVLMANTSFTRRDWARLRQTLVLREAEKRRIQARAEITKFNNEKRMELTAPPQNKHLITTTYVVSGSKSIELPPTISWTIQVDEAAERKFIELDFCLKVVYQADGKKFHCILYREGYIFKTTSKNLSNAYISTLRQARRRLRRLAAAHEW